MFNIGTACRERQTMKRPGQHGMLAQQTAAEKSRLDFLVSLKGFLRRELEPANRVVYERVRADFVAEHTREPRSADEVGRLMDAQDFYQMFDALCRVQQEHYVDATAACVERQLPELTERYRRFADEPIYGSLRLNPDMEIPDYQAAVDIHCVPGSYFFELGEDDVFPGARSDIGAYVFSRGMRGAYNEDKGVSLAGFIRERFGALRPARILDLGCTSGNNTIPFVDAFPDAEVHAIDLSAPCLRYAHARAESLGKAVYFSQQNAEHTDFPDGFFDVVVSQILLHETSRHALYAIIGECYRLLSHGGVMAHLDVPVRKADPYTQFMSDRRVDYNNEPFWSALARLDVTVPMQLAGFRRSGIFNQNIRSRLGAGQRNNAWWVFGASKG